MVGSLKLKAPQTIQNTEFALLIQTSQVSNQGKASRPANQGVLGDAFLRDRELFDARRQILR